MRNPALIQYMIQKQITFKKGRYMPCSRRHVENPDALINSTSSETAPNDRASVVASSWRERTILTFLILCCWIPGKAFATPAPTNTKLTITSGGNVVSTVVSPAVITLNVAVTVGGSPVTLGQVIFCDGFYYTWHVTAL
jgi:hypothetical protein